MISIIFTLVDEDTEVMTALVGEIAYVEHDKFTGTGFMAVALDDGIDGKERERVRGLWGGWPEIRTPSDRGASMGGKGAKSLLQFIPSKLPSAKSMNFQHQ